MNNPEANFMSPLGGGGGPPAVKKQRGGATPRPFSGRATDDRLRRPHAPPGGGGPRDGSSGPPAVPPLTIVPSSYSASGGGGGGGGDNTTTGASALTAAADEAIARRRAELRRLQAQRERTTKRTAERAAAVGGGAKAVMPAPGAGAAAAAVVPPLLQPMPPPMRPARAERHHSDLFPTVPKSPSPAGGEGGSRMTLQDVAFVDDGKTTLPSLPLVAAAPLAVGTTTMTGVRARAGPPPPTPAVNRKLDFPPSSSSSRSKSAPPVRHPPGPPPPPPPTPKQGGTTTERLEETAAATPTARTKTSSSSARPVPVTPGALLLKDKKKKARTGGGATNSGGPHVGPPPPGGDGPTNIPFSRTTERAAAKIGKQEGGPTSPHLVQSSKTIAVAVPVIPLPLVTTAPPSVVRVETTKRAVAEKAAVETSSSSPLPSSSFGPHPPVLGTKTTTTAAAVADPHKDPASSLLQTPVTSHHSGGEDKANTPPSSGSSSRRESMRLLVVAAGEAATVSKKLHSVQTTHAVTTVESYTAATTGATATGAGAGGTIPSLVSESQKRLEEAYTKAQREKQEALGRIKELEDKLTKSLSAHIDRDNNNNDVSSSLTLEHLLRLAEEEGPQAAIEWARSQTRSTEDGDPFLPSSLTPVKKGTGLFPIMGMESPIHHRRRMARRTATPAPRRFTGTGGDGVNDDGGAPPSSVAPAAAAAVAEAIEREKVVFFRDAAQCVPHEYTSDLAMYHVRRPYGLETQQAHDDDGGLFGLASLTPHGTYSQRAHVSAPASIEVVATVTADHSVLLLADVAGVRYRTNPNAKEWKAVPNVDDADRPLGNVMYIDEHANECEYSLDQVLEEAMLVREQYCSTMTSMALSLERRPPPPAAASRLRQEEDPPKQGTVPESVDVPGGPVDTGGAPAAATDKEGGGLANAIAPEKQAPPADVDGASSGSADVLIVFIGLMFSSLFGLLYFLLIGLPLRVVQTAVVLGAVYAVTSLLYMYAAQDYNDWMLQSMPGSVNANDLVFFSNQRPGVM